MWIFSCSTVLRVYRFLDTVLMDSDRYRCIFRSTTIVFEITGISAPYSFPTISYRFRFREKNVKTKVIWPPIDRFRSFSSLPTGDAVALSKPSPLWKRCMRDMLTKPLDRVHARAGISEDLGAGLSDPRTNPLEHHVRPMTLSLGRGINEGVYDPASGRGKP
jgi:hypothetical protein